MSNFNRETHHRHTIRLHGYDYSQAGAYFVTLCTNEGTCLFGDVIDDKMKLNAYGIIAADSWKWLAKQYQHVSLDSWVLMPNHLHGIIVISDVCGGKRAGDIFLHSDVLPDSVDLCRGGSRTAPTVGITTTNINPKSFIKKPLGRIIGAFKTVSTKQINIARDMAGTPVWQRNYYDRIIRNENELNRIREYIETNPTRWDIDSENPE